MLSATAAMVNSFSQRGYDTISTLSSAP